MVGPVGCGCVLGACYGPVGSVVRCLGGGVSGVHSTVVALGVGAYCIRELQRVLLHEDSSGRDCGQLNWCVCVCACVCMCVCVCVCMCVCVNTWVLQSHK